MKRFATAYLSIVVIATLLANLIYIFLYGRQFLYDAAQLCTESCKNISENDAAFSLVILNVVLLGLFFFGWWVVKLINRTHSE